MDLITGIIGLSLFVACATAMFALAFYSTKEKTFDDILKEQKKKWKESKPQKIEKKVVKQPVTSKPKPKKKEKQSDGSSKTHHVKQPPQHVADEEIPQVKYLYFRSYGS